jgi:hypothetical protein
MWIQALAAAAGTVAVAAVGHLPLVVTVLPLVVTVGCRRSLGNWLAVCALTMLAALADATCSAATAGSGWWPPSLSTVMVTS